MAESHVNTGASGGTAGWGCGRHRPDDNLIGSNHKLSVEEIILDLDLNAVGRVVVKVVHGYDARIE